MHLDRVLHKYSDYFITLSIMSERVKGPQNDDNAVHSN